MELDLLFIYFFLLQKTFRDASFLVDTYFLLYMYMSIMGLCVVHRSFENFPFYIAYVWYVVLQLQNHRLSFTSQVRLEMTQLHTISLRTHTYLTCPSTKALLPNKRAYKKCNFLNDTLKTMHSFLYQMITSILVARNALLKILNGTDKS